MRLLRGLAGVVLWILAALLGLVAVILCITLVLLPLGLPLLGLTRRLFTRAVRLMMPQTVAHPVQELQKSSGRGRDHAAAALPGAAEELAERGRSLRRSLRRSTPKVADITRGRRRSRRLFRK